MLFCERDKMIRVSMETHPNVDADMNVCASTCCLAERGKLEVASVSVWAQWHFVPPPKPPTRPASGVGVRETR